MFTKKIFPFLVFMVAISSVAVAKFHSSKSEAWTRMSDGRMVHFKLGTTEIAPTSTPTLTVTVTMTPTIEITKTPTPNITETPTS